MLQRFGKYLVGVTVLAIVVFAMTGRLDLPMVWGYLCVVVLAGLATSLFVTDEGLAEERRNPGKDGSDWSVPKLGPWFLFGHIVVGTVDVGRLHWSDVVPSWLQLIGLIGFGASLALLIWSMAANPFFSPVVRIQAERGHHVIIAGPYRYIRHPGYAAMLLLGPASSIALGSLLALLPIAAWMILIVRRTVIEDRVLNESLNGFREYSELVRFRVLPGLW